MKRLIRILLAAMLVFSALNAHGLSYTLDEKLFRQVRDGSGLKATVKAEMTGGGFSILDPAANALIGALSGGELSLRYLKGVGTLKGMEELELILLKAGQMIGDMRLVRDPQFEQLSSSLLGAGRYVDARDGGALLALLTGQDPAWPPVEGVLFRLNTAETTWQAAAAKKLEAYSVRLSLWLQGFTKTETVRDASSALQTRVTVTVPVVQLKTQVKQLLLDMYGDTELLALLAQEMDSRQAAAYLQPGMLNGFFQSLDLLPLTGNLVSQRLMDAQGQLLEIRLMLPMGGARGIRTLEYTFTANQTGGLAVIKAELEPKKAGNDRGPVISLVYEGGETGTDGGISYAGTLSIQPEAAGDAFTVDKQEGDTPADVYAFSLLYAPSPEVEDLVAGSSTRDFAFSLLITPQGEGVPSTQQIKADVRLQSKMNSRAATYFTGSILWQDQGTAAQLKLDISGNTAAPWTIPSVDPSGAVRVDALSASQLTGLGEQLRTVLQNAFAAMLLKLAIPTAAPQ